MSSALRAELLCPSLSRLLGRRGGVWSPSVRGTRRLARGKRLVRESLGCGIPFTQKRFVKVERGALLWLGRAADGGVDDAAPLPWLRWARPAIAPSGAGEYVLHGLVARALVDPDEVVRGTAGPLHVPARRRMAAVSRPSHRRRGEVMASRVKGGGRDGTNRGVCVRGWLEGSGPYRSAGWQLIGWYASSVALARTHADQRTCQEAACLSWPSN